MHAEAASLHMSRERKGAGSNGLGCTCRTAVLLFCARLLDTIIVIAHLGHLPGAELCQPSHPTISQGKLRYIPFIWLAIWAVNPVKPSGQGGGDLGVVEAILDLERRSSFWKGSTTFALHRALREDGAATREIQVGF